MNLRKFFAELKRRNVYKVAIAYAVVAWLLMQIATQVFPFLEIPNWAIRLVIMLLVIGFPVALILAWAFELTPEGIKRTEDVDVSKSVTRKTGRKLDFFIIAVLLLVIAALLFQRLHPKVSPAVSSSLEKSIAVLPFENLSEEKANAYFADGIQDEIMTKLASVSDLKVISRTSVMQYKSGIARNLREIGQQLGVAHLLEGNVQRAGGKVRVNAQLIDARNDAHLWAQTYDRDLADVFAIQSEIAQAIADQLQAKITGIEKQEIAAKATNNAEAYDAYLRGLALYLRGFQDIDLVNSTKSLEEAVRLDPKFAQAWALLARGHGNLYFFGLDTTPARREAARNALARAEELQPDLAETQLAKAWYLFRVERDYEGAKRVCEGLRPKWPNNSEVPTLMSYVLTRQGHIAEAEVQLQEALTLDPRSVLLLKVFALGAIQNRRFADALKRLDRVLDVAPGDTDAISRKAVVYQAVGELDNAEVVLAPLQSATADANTASALAQQRLLQRRYPAGIALLQSSLAKAGPALEASRSLDRISLGDLQRLAGDAATARASYAQARDELEAQLKQQPDNTDVMLGLAQAYAGLQDRKLALQYAEKALELRPESQDVLVARKYQETLARIASQVGETDRAIKILQHLLTVPYGHPPITPALLRLDPTWDPLRGDPRFEKIVTSLAPKDSSPQAR
jgi:TolB-like protein/Flp pilus assembly protein TadD